LSQADLFKLTLTFLLYTLRAKTGQGVLAEYCLVPKQHLRRKPEDLDFEKAAAVPLATLTALTALVDAGGIKKGNAAGKKVFIVRFLLDAASKDECLTFRSKRNVFRTEAVVE